MPQSITITVVFAKLERVATTHFALATMPPKDPKTPKPPSMTLTCMFAKAAAQGAVKIEKKEEAQEPISRCLAPVVEAMASNRRAKATPTNTAPVSAPQAKAPPERKAPEGASVAPPALAPKATAVKSAASLPPEKLASSCSGSGKPAAGELGLVPEQADAAAGGPSPSKVSDDKNLYNKFNYKLRGAPEAVKESWRQLQKDDDMDTMKEFMEIVVASKRG
jgi:hypothetical protein